MKKITTCAVSLCMITKDEEQFVARCLTSVRSMVDEIIVADTGSSDRTREIARRFGARIFDVQWTNDFAAARNQAIAKASGQWIFALDADEVISERDGAALRNLVENPSGNPVAYSFTTRNYTLDTHQVGWVANKGDYKEEQAGTGWVPTQKVRLFPNREDIRYAYAVHEMVEPAIARAGVIIRKCGIPIHHYGPLKGDRQQGKMEAYYRLGQKKVDRTGANPVALYELAVQAGILGKFTQAIALWEKFLALKPQVPEAYVHLGTAYFQCNDYVRAQQAAVKAMALAPQMKEAIYNFSLCEIIGGNGCKAIPRLERLADKFPEFLPAKFILAAAHICSGNQHNGRMLLEKLRHTQMGSHLATTCMDLARRLISANRSDAARALIESALAKSARCHYDHNLDGGRCIDHQNDRSGVKNKGH